MKALEWLKENNPLYANITISSSRLAQLPEDDVPFELLAISKQSTDVDTLYAEQDGYVPSQEGGDDGEEEGESASDVSDAGGKRSCPLPFGHLNTDAWHAIRRADRPRADRARGATYVTSGCR